MLNDRDDKYEGQEESEYHFSDEEVSYEVETESPKAATSTSSKKENILDRLTRSKRMLITLGVFLVLVFVVYKMVAPTSTAPAQPSDLTPAITAQNQQRTTPVTTQVTTTTAAQQPPAVLPVGNATNNIQAAAPATTTTTTTSSQEPSTNGQAPANNVNAATQPANQNEANQPLQFTNPALIAMQQSYQQTANAAPAAATTTTTTTAQPQAQPVTTVTTQAPAASNSQMAALVSENEKLAGQLQAEYAQKINDFSTQNKAMQDQIQTLNTRVASMETQMNQLMQVITARQAGQSSSSEASSSNPVVQTEHTEGRVPYSVQAIIPGRAWLRSDSGETVTVAEGDMVKDLGRVTKIDPYDGIVEINTGTKTVSLSYGNGV